MELLMLSLATLFVIPSISFAEDVVEYRDVAIKSIECTNSGGTVEFKSSEGAELAIDIRGRAFRAPYYQMTPQKFCLGLKKASSNKKPMNLRTAFLSSSEAELREEIVGYFSDGSGGILSDTRSLGYIQTLICGNPNRGTQLCLFRGTQSNYFFKFFNGFNGAAFYKATIVNQQKDGGATALVLRASTAKDSISDLKFLLPPVISSATEIEAELLVNGSKSYPPFIMRQPLEPRPRAGMHFD